MDARRINAIGLRDLEVDSKLRSLLVVTFQRAIEHGPVERFLERFGRFEGIPHAGNGHRRQKRTS